MEADNEQEENGTKEEVKKDLPAEIVDTKDEEN